MKGKTVEQLECKRCGYEWEPRVPEPKACPSCKQYLWRTPAKDRNA